MTVPEPLRIGLLGGAAVARRRTLPAIAACPDTRLVAVACRDGDRAREWAGAFGCAAEPGYDSLLARDDVDAVYVPLPAGLHAEWSAKALAAGKHVLVEKPMATTARQARELADLAAERSLVLMENRMFAMHPQHAAVRTLVDAGAIGELRVVTAAMAIPALPADDIRYAAHLAGGALLDVGFYPVQAALMYLGEQVEVCGAHLRVDPGRGVDVGGAALLRDRAGVCAQLTFGFEHAYRASYELWGSTGRIRLERAFTPPSTLPTVLRIERQDHVEERTLPAADQFAALVARFASAVRGETDWRPDLRAGLLGLSILDDIRAGGGAHAVEGRGAAAAHLVE
ncbi:Gfo/Idh/MocA family protein [Actinokineospora sp. UTMC 2448]|uniref:Gfo/Idh/MocA family protein n=1 Tax=Actinokineospora sp. UTMC 2448 TaxID=2268449 RepID=UPI002164847C|nr:Gfo/Idh/MocA family oxidoreductase [Actinokineospora sp. UTMC 2448]UVS78680.1 TDP-4-keto-6-deoxy-D-glucose-3-ketoreductase PerS1 [Actinokineospora sp. UTMC 2448]